MKKTKGFVSEFKEFVLRGNVMDLAVAVIIGAAFQVVVNSLVNDVIMPVITLVTGGINFNDWFISLDGGHYETLEAAQAAGASTLNYGVFITAWSRPAAWRPGRASPPPGRRPRRACPAAAPRPRW